MKKWIKRIWNIIGPNPQDKRFKQLTKKLIAFDNSKVPLPSEEYINELKLLLESSKNNETLPKLNKIN